MAVVRVGSALLVAAALMAFLPCHEAGGCGCPPLWTSFGNSCYRLITFKNSTWHNAEMHCRGFTVPCSETDEVKIGHLASVHSVEENDFLTALYDSVRNKRVSTRVWIGLHDTRTEDEWEWSDHSRRDFTLWAPSQPNSYQGEQDCVSFNTNNNYEWGDLPCGAETEWEVESFICKLPRW